jgi:predicted nucleic acid-binding protein
MPVVIDANLIVVIMANDPRASVVEAQLQTWLNQGVGLHAPQLLPYEVANGMTRVISSGALPAERLTAEWELISRLPVTYHPMDILGPRVIQIALRLQRSSAYDAAYIVMAQELAAELWTLDGPLAHNASSLGFAVNLL